jgi:hypothetical protein
MYVASGLLLALAPFHTSAKPLHRFLTPVVSEWYQEGSGDEGQAVSEVRG